MPDQDWVLWGVLVGLLNLVLALSVTIHAVLWKRDNRAVIGWVGLAWLAPVFGSCCYFFFGINRIIRKASALRGRETIREEAVPELSEEELAAIEAFAREHPNMSGVARAGRNLAGVRVTPRNEVVPLIDGDEAYPAMLQAIRDSKRSVALMSYIFDSDRAGKQFLEALQDAVARGVEVRVLVDDVGSKYYRPNIIGLLRESGIKAASFLPTRLPRLPTYANLRNHRKILVCDGRLGFTGGTNIREGHCLAWNPKQPVQCLHFQLDGPVVGHLMHVFATDWEFVTHEELRGELWFASERGEGKVWARGIEHGPDENFEKLKDLIAAALACARKRVRIVTPYFLPSPALIHALNVAALRGVEVEVYMPRENNIVLVQWAASAQLWQILNKGCRVFYTTPPFDHTKLMIVDDVWALIGSTNWDPRSLRLNFEFNVECYNTELATQLNEIIDQKAASATAVTLEDVNNRSLPVRLRDGLARLLTPYL